MPDEINCSHINRSNAIQKRVQFLDSANSNGEEGAIQQLHEIWDGHEDLPANHTRRQIIDLRNKIRRTIHGIETHLLKENIIVRDNASGLSDTDVTNLGIKMLRSDLLGENGNAGRASYATFKNQVPDYMKQFINYVNFICDLPQDEQKLFLRQFPPDAAEEYACNGGAKMRLNDVLKMAKPSDIVLRAHNEVIKDIGIQFRKSIKEGNHPHAESFAEYLVGISDIVKHDDMYLTPRNKITLSQIHDLIHNYDEKLSASYLEILKRKAETLIDEIVQITVEDNNKALTGDAHYRRKEINDLCEAALDIDDFRADKIIGALSEISERVDKNNDPQEIYWKVDKQGEDGIRETLLTQVNQVIEGKSDYFQRVSNERRENSMPVNLTSLSSVNALIESSKTLLLPFDNRSDSCPQISDMEKNAIYALRALCQESRNQDIFHFIAVSDHLIDPQIGAPEECKNHILDKIKADNSLQEDTILTDFVRCIFDKREIYLGADNMALKVEDTHPFLHAIVTKNIGKISEILATDDDIRWSEELTRNDGDSRGKSRSPLHYAFHINDKDIASTFLTHPVFGMKPTTPGNQTFNFVAQHGLCETVKAFLEVEMNPETLQAKTKSGFTALHLAAGEGHAETVKTLLTHNKYMFINTRSENNNTAFYHAATMGHTDTIDVFLEHMDPQLINSKNINGNTALHGAAKNGHVETVQTLLKRHDDDLLHARNDEGNTALHRAAQAGHAHIVQILLENEDRNFLDVKNNLSMTALQMAAETGHSKTVRIMTNRLEDFANQEGNVTAFDLALCESTTNTAEIFLTYCSAEFLNAKDENGNTAFDRAVLDGDLRVVKKFLDHGKPEVLNVEDENGNTAFDRAVLNGDVNVVETFLNHAEPEVLNAKDENGNTAFDRAVLNGDMRIVEKFLNHAKPEVLNAKDENGNTAFHRAVLDGDINVMKKFFYHAPPEVLNAKGAGSLTALRRAIKNDNVETLQAFLDHADIEILDVPNHPTALSCAFSMKSDKSIEAIFDSDRYLNSVDKNGGTLLHRIVKDGKPIVLEKFLNSPKTEVLPVQDNDKNTAFHIAAHRGSRHIMKLFLNHTDSDMLSAKNRKGDSAFDIVARGSPGPISLNSFNPSTSSTNIKMFLDAKKPGSLNDDGLNDSPCESEAIKSLLKRGIFLNKRDFTDRPELQEIITTARSKANKLIAKINSRGQKSATTFIADEAPESLEEYINVSSRSGLTGQRRNPLQKAAELGKTELMELLVNKGAIIDVVNEKGKTARYYAEKKHQTKAIELLDTPRTSVENPTVETAQVILSH